MSEHRYSWTAQLSTTPAYRLAEYTYTGQFSYKDDPSTSGVTEGFGLMFYCEAFLWDNARWLRSVPVTEWRGYDPALGRFTAPDSIIPGGMQGLDRYAYVNNAPTRFTDPSGHYIVEDQGSKRGCHDLGYCSISTEMNIKIGRDYSAVDGKILRDLLRSKNEDAQKAVDYLVNNNIPITHVEEGELGKGVGAAWWNLKHPTEFDKLWIDDNQLEQDYSYGLSLVVHETVHLEQGATWALSVLGEQEAWQVGFKVYKDLTGQYPGKRDVAESIVNLPYDASRTTLEKARDLMLQWQPNYNANGLPLYPLDFYFIRD